MLPWRIKQFLQRRSNSRIAALYSKNDYITAYRKHTDIRVEQDPHEAVGGYWEEIGALQFDFLKERGLKPYHYLLDIGCGSLRAGRFFVEYLEPSRYTGLEISAKAIEYAHELIHKQQLSHKNPSLIINQDGHLDFSEIRGTFDFLLAQSVFTHLPDIYIKECFANLHKIMTPGSRFFFTYQESQNDDQPGLKDFRQSRSFFEILANEHNMIIDDWSDEYLHPRSQIMLEARFSTKNI